MQTAIQDKINITFKSQYKNVLALFLCKFLRKGENMRVRLMDKERMLLEDITFPIDDKIVDYIQSSAMLDKLGYIDITSLDSSHLRGYEQKLYDLDLKRLNELSAIVESFDFEQLSRFNGGCNIASALQEENLSLDALFNVAENVIQDRSFDHFPARDEKELAEFFLDNGLVKELEKIDTVSYEWMIDKLDLQKVGEDIAEKFGDNTCFTSSGFVVLQGEIEELYEKQTQGMGGLSC